MSRRTLQMLREVKIIFFAACFGMHYAIPRQSPKSSIYGTFSDITSTSIRNTIIIPVELFPQ